MAKLAKEATTMRRILESLFRYFDNGDLWSTKHGIAAPVLKDLQFLMDKSGTFSVPFSLYPFRLYLFQRPYLMIPNEFWLIDCIFILTGQSTHVLLSILIKHLDHKNVLKLPSMQLDIVAVTTALAKEAKVEPSVAIIGAVSDCMRHLRKSIHCSLDDANLGDDVKNWNKS